MTPTEQDKELREQFVDAMWNYFGIEDKSELDHFRTIFDEVVNPLITAHTNAEIAKAVKEAKPFPVGGSEFADGYMAGIKQYETNLMKFIERAKLKEVK